MDWSEVDQEVAGSAADDARATRARRSAQPSNKEGLEDPTLETPLKDTGLPPSPPAPPIDGHTLSDLEVLLTIATIKCKAEECGRSMDTLAQLRADRKALEEELEEFRKGKAEVKAKKAEYNARPEVKARKAEWKKGYMARPEVKAKQAEYEARPERKAKKAKHNARPEVKAKRARRTKQEQDQDAAEQAETSKLGPFGADPFGLRFGADPPESQPDIENRCLK